MEVERKRGHIVDIGTLSSRLPLLDSDTNNRHQQQPGHKTAATAAARVAEAEDHSENGKAWA